MRDGLGRPNISASTQGPSGRGTTTEGNAASSPSLTLYTPRHTRRRTTPVDATLCSPNKMATLLIEALKGAQVCEETMIRLVASHPSIGRCSLRQSATPQQPVNRRLPFPPPPAPPKHMPQLPTTHNPQQQQAEVAQQQGLFEQVKRAGRLTGLLAQELRAAVSLSPFGVRAVRVRRCV